MVAPVYIVPFVLLLLPVTNTGTAIPEGHHLWEALHHFDVLHKNHVRVLGEQSKQLHFNTLGREFHLLLSPRKDLVHRNLQATVVGESGRQEVIDIYTDHFLTGTLLDDPESKVHAHFDHKEGLLSASIQTHNDHYYIEPSHRHFSQPHDFHMISYRASDLKYNLTNNPNHHFCGTNHHSFNSRTHSSSHFSIDDTLSLSKDPVYRGHFSRGGYSSEDKHRLKRQSLTETTGRSLCPLHLVGTTSFHNEFSTENSSRSSIQQMVMVVDMVDQMIFRTSEWSDDIGPRGFSIKNVTLFTSSSSGPEYNRQGRWFSEDLLRSFSSQDWSHVCLAHLFTADTFTDGRLGVAYIASSDRNTIGGICSEPIRNFNGIPLSTGNVGVSSLLRDSRRALIAEAILVVGHELGHNWGSEHDPTRGTAHQCNPSLNDGGKYLMFSSATDGQQSNNNRFSPCSRRDISDVLRAKASSCFVDEVPSTCGNYAVDEGEQCDAGFEGVIGQDQCCDTNCRLRPQAVCSDVNEECCSGCLFADNSTVCRIYPTGSPTCLQSVNCSGLNGSCPSEDIFVTVGTSCQGTGVCLASNTQCNDSLPCNPAPNPSPNVPLKCFNLCEQQNKTKCFCDPFTESECWVCCRAKEENSTCRPLKPTVFLANESICVGGECRNGVCKPIARDLASRLFDLFSNIDINLFLEFMKENIVSSVLIIVTIFWVPVCLLIHFIDYKVWKEFSEEADKQEQELHLLNKEDQQDLYQLDMLARAQPDAQIDTSQAKKALQKQFSVIDSIYCDSYVLGNTYYFGSASPSKDEHRRNPSASLDPANHNIFAFVQSGDYTSRPRTNESESSTL